MSKAVLDAEAILQHASPLVHQTADEIQTLVESACKETVDNLKRIHLLGRVSIAVSQEVAETTLIPRPRVLMIAARVLAIGLLRSQASPSPNWPQARS